MISRQHRRLNPIVPALIATIVGLLAVTSAHATPGDLYVSNVGGSTVERFTPSGSASVFANAGLSGPRGIAFDAKGSLYAANFDNSTVERFTPDGTPSLFAKVVRA